MQRPESVRPETLGLAAFFESLEKHPEHFVGLLVFGMHRAAVVFRALFLKPEMLFGVGFEKIDQLDQEFAGLPGRIGIV